MGWTTRTTTQWMAREYGDMDLADRCQALAIARELASETMSEELDQDARLGVRLAAATRGACPDRRVARLDRDDPRRAAYVAALRDLRREYAAERAVRS